jgi:hypothetical protein
MVPEVTGEFERERADTDPTLTVRATGHTVAINQQRPGAPDGHSVAQSALPADRACGHGEAELDVLLLLLLPHPAIPATHSTGSIAPSQPLELRIALLIV